MSNQEDNDSNTSVTSSREELENKIEQNQHNQRAFWKEEEENILKEWADKAMCYEWMHSKSHKIYKNKNGWYTIPVIAISTITGTANFAQSRIPEKYVNTYVITVGAFNILAGIITTVYQYLKISELNESHRVAQLSWGKFYRNVKTELAKHPLDRMGPVQLLKISKEEFDRLLEISPPIPDKVITLFRQNFGKDGVSDDISRPEICDVIAPTSVYQMTEFEREEMKSLLTKRKESTAPIKEFIDPKLEEFKTTFYELNNRMPTEQEIQENYYNLFSIKRHQTVMRKVQFRGDTNV